MNHIYRRIWSRARQCWVVTSELATSCCPGTKKVEVWRSSHLLVLVALAVAGGVQAAGPGEESHCDSDDQRMLYGCLNDSPIGMLALGRGWAAGSALYSGEGSIAIGGDTSAGDYSVSLGSRTTSYAKESVAVGYGVRATNGDRSVAIGFEALSSGGYNVSVGSKAQAHGLGATVLGNDARAYSTNSIAMGSGARTVESLSGISRIAIGGNAFAGTAGYTGAIAVGGGARAEYSGLALGYEAKALAIGSVALGASSQADESNSVSVGNSSTKRRIVNVADGRLSTTSTDAVTGKQLYATEQKIGSLYGMLKAGSHTDSFVIGTGSVSASANTVSVGSASKRRRIQYLADGVIGSGSTDAMTGNQLHATNTKVAAVEKIADTAKMDLVVVREIAQNATNRIDATTLALGRGATAENGSYGISTALGNNAKAYNGRSVALGDDARAGVDADGNKVANQNAGVSVGAGTRSANGAVATGFRTNASGNFSIAVGGDAKAEAEHGTAVGHLSKASASQATALGRGSEATAQFASALGNLAKATNTSSVALGDRAQASHENAVALGAGAVTASANSVSVGSASRKRKIQYIADGVVGAGSTDAITGNQLHTTNQAVAKAQTAADGATTTANAAKMESGKALAETVVLEGLVNQAAVDGSVRLGEKNSGTQLDVRNSANANRKLTGVADGAVSTSSDDAINGRQLNATNDKVATVEGIAKAAGTEAAVAKTDAARGLAETAALGGLVAQVSASGNVRLGEKNIGTVLDVRNSAGGSRTIAGVLDGTLNADSSDAINGRQLYAVSEVANGARRSAQEAIDRIGSIAEQSKFFQVGSGGPDQGAKAGLVAVAIGDSAEASMTSEGAVAIGSFAAALAKNSVSLGRAAYVDAAAENGFSLGVFSSVEAGNGVAIGAGSAVEKTASNSAAIGAASVAAEVNVVSFGAGLLQRRLVNVARGTADHNATTISQLKDSLATLGGSAGMDANGNIIAPTYTVQGGTQNTVEDALMALDGAVITAGRRADKVEGQLSSIFQDSPSARADGLSQIALNGVNGMVLTNLADGRVAPGSRDAVTGNQLYAAEQKISQNRNDLEAMRKEREMGQQAMRELDASVIDYGGARLTGVADGSVSGESHDVVTGRQLFGVSDRVSKIEHQGRFLKINTDELSEDAFAGFLGVAIGDSAMTGVDGGTALGAYASALGVSSVALGRGSGVSADAPYGFAVGTGSQVHSARGIAIGSGSVVDSGAAGSLALGAGSAATEVGVVSFGNLNMKRRLVNIANGTANHNAATVGQLRGALSALGGEVDANGNIVGPRFNVQGQAQSTLNGALEALDGAVVTNSSRVDKVETQLRSVFQDVPSVRADGVNQLTLAGAHGMVISNVANGVIAAGSRDAVNGGQLHSMQQQLNGRMDGLEQRIDDAPAPRALASSSVPKPQTEETPVLPEGKDSQQVASVGEGDKPTPQPKANKDDTPKPQVDTAELEKMLARANEYTDGAISNFERRLDKMDKRFNRMAAMSSAQSAMAMNTAGLATYNRLGAGVGYSEGESAMAVGYQRVLNEKGSATFSLNGAFTNSGERSMGVGVGIGW